MRKLIRKWLGIKDEDKVSKKYDLRREIGKAVEALLKGDSDFFYYSGEYRSILQKALESAAETKVYQMLKIEREYFLKSIREEWFIDEVVHRINKKQVEK